MALDKIHFSTPREFIKMYGGGARDITQMNGQKAQENQIDVLKKSSQAVVISDMGRQIGELYNNLKSIPREGDNMAALEGFRKTVVDFAQNSNAKSLGDFLTTAKSMSSTPEGTARFKEALSVASEVKETGGDLKSWWNAFGNLDTKLQEPFTSETRDILNGSGSSQQKAETVNNLSNTINQSFDKMHQEGSDFFASLASLKSLEEKNSFMNNFREGKLTDKNLI